jgi:hypothetical protein
MKAIKPPKNLRTVPKPVSLMRDGEEALKAALRRMAEISRLKAMLPTIKPPAKIGKRALDETEKNHFDLAVVVANKSGDASQNQAYGKAVVAATQSADSRFFEIITAAMKAAKKEREESMSAASAHVLLALTAKLELEQETGELPTTRQVSDRAHDIGSVWFSVELFDKLAAPDNKAAWSKARAAAELSYLPPAKRGEGWQNKS